MTMRSFPHTNSRFPHPSRQNRLTRPPTATSTHSMLKMLTGLHVTSRTPAR
ncbi:hypothetical protein J2S49_000002 [Arcanobacterium wilhelmae]|uniref:Uncharacterized protein n=1 Tax=Arcanobacterium wilhelmae TaxID=1803177 RepID=A0ABT9N9N1_9ACTO|nr:hypothetical protein [Arcanobacterium wilhelmae]